ncbi:MAG: bifunctional (p)ppGpp synthetase/guanosine-3',5'-bis(diphosphate) 3'-pyrophosphohydrolase [Eubacteriales bacterium]
MEKLLKSYQQLEDKFRSYSPGEDYSLMEKAFRYAHGFHEGQLRKDGTPYITHPLAVAKIMAELGMDRDALIAALLHDVIEDTEASYDDVAREFSVDVADLVEAVTKLSLLHYTTKEEEQMENLRKMFMAMAKDIRVILIKICDRLHNMRTMEYQSPKKQKEKSLETMEIYAPIAHRLGMQKLKWELEDLSLRYLDPIGYGEIEAEMEQRQGLNEDFLQQAKDRITTRIAQENIFCTTSGRVKHTYSIYRKMFEQNRSLDEIFDLYAVRVIVDDVAQCYNVLGCVHDLYNPILNRFKDYISTPKPNLYQSLHTTVIGRQGIPFEVQIRTWAMHHTAEYGVAAHWKYKQGLANHDLGTEHDFEWVRKLLETQQETDSEEFLRSLKVDMFDDEVFVFTPEGDVKSLPSRATPIDFAYAIHTEVGNKMVGAKVNGRMVGFDYQLQNGEVVEVIMSQTAKGPSRDWLHFARSAEARNKIRQWFKKECRGENIVNGRNSLENEIKYHKLNTVPQGILDDVFEKICEKLSLAGKEDLYALIGYGGITSSKVASRMKDELAKIGKLQKSADATEEIPQEEKKPSKKTKGREISGIVVDGMDDCMVKFARCCCPVPGDKVVGFITRGYGVSVHRVDCTNVNKDNRKEDSRWIPIQWGDAVPISYQTTLELSAKDRDGLLLDMSNCLAQMKTKLISVSMRATPDGFAVATIDMEVHNKHELTQVMNKLSQMKSVYHVGRVAGA